MEIAAFADMTYRVLKTTSLEEFLPTLCLPERREILTLDGVPRELEDDVRVVALDWAESKVKVGEEFLVAFRDGDRCFRIIRRTGGKLNEALFPDTRNA